MALAERRAESVWEGNLSDGKGRITVGSGAIDELPVTWAARTERSDGKTSPEELIAAAHASCFSMFLSNVLSKAGTTPDSLRVSAVCTLDNVEGGLKITTMDLDVQGMVPGVDEATFQSAAEEAKNGCPVSGALKNSLEINLKASLA
jgi:lipoyl-dependent peroxiredoxin